MNPRLMKLAVTQAAKSSSRFRLGAVLARRNRVISCGYNFMDKTHPFARKFLGDETLCGIHAEVDALRGIKIEEAKGATIYVARLLRNDHIALAKPCPNCQAILSIFKVRKMIYSTADGWEEEPVQ